MGYIAYGKKMITKINNIIIILSYLSKSNIVT